MKNLILLMLLSQSIALMAQSESNDDPAYKRSYFAYYGFGFGGQKTALNFGVTGQIGEHSTLGIAAQNTYKDPDYGWYGWDGSEVQQTISGTFSVMYGRIMKRPWGHFSLQAGPSMVAITRYEERSAVVGDYIGEDEEGFGVLIQAGILPAYKFVGVGVTAFVNVNSVFTHAGITLNLALGRINYKK